MPKGICGPVIEENGQKRIMIYSDFEQNVLLNRTEPSYMATVAQSCEGDSARLEAWTRGSWDVVSGGFFDEIFYKYGNTIKEPSFVLPEGGRCFFSYDWGGPSPSCFLYFWENTDGQDVQFSDGKIRSGRRGDIHIIGENIFSRASRTRAATSVSPICCAHMLNTKFSADGAFVVQWMASGQTA